MNCYYCKDLVEEQEIGERISDTSEVICRKCILDIKFNTPTWYKDIAVIPRGFHYVLENLDGLSCNWDTCRQIDVFIELLQEKKEEYKFTRQVNLTSGIIRNATSGYKDRFELFMDTDLT